MNQINQTRTKEQIEYDKGLKTLHELSLKKALSEEGIDTSKVPRKDFDEIRRLLSKQEPIRIKYQTIITKTQQEAQAIINKAQLNLQGEIAEIQKEIEEIVKRIKIEQGIIPSIEAPSEAEKQEETQPEMQAEPPKNTKAGDEPSSE